MQIDKFDQIQTSQTGGQPHSDTSPSEVSECSLKYFKIVTWLRCTGHCAYPLASNVQGSDPGFMYLIVALERMKIRRTVFKYPQWPICRNKGNFLVSPTIES